MSQRILDYYQTLLGWKIAQSEIGRERAWKMRTFFSAAAILRGYDMGVGEQWPQAISAANGMGIYCSLGHLQGIYWFCWGCWSRKDAVNLKTTITVHSRFLKKKKKALCGYKFFSSSTIFFVSIWCSIMSQAVIVNAYALHLIEIWSNNLC